MSKARKTGIFYRFGIKEMIDIIRKAKIVMEVARKQELDSFWQTRNFNPVRLVIPFTRLYFPLSGEGYMMYSGKQYHLRPGSLFLIPPYAPVEVSCPERLVKYWTHFNVFMADSEVDLFNIADTVNELPVPDVKEYCILFEHLTKWYPTSHSEKYYKVPPLAEFEAQSALHLLLEPFYENILSNTKNLDRSNLRLVKLLNYIEKNLDRELTLKQLAAIVHLNPTYLSNLFSEKFGISLIQYCNNRRIVRATDLLIHTDYSIEEIAWRQGAESTAAFSRLFKRHVGCSPVRFRQLKQGRDTGPES